MKFKQEARRAVPWRAIVATAGAALLLAACGGGDQVEKFAPRRVLAFGDENSLIVDNNADRNGVVKIRMPDTITRTVMMKSSQFST